MRGLQLQRGGLLARLRLQERRSLWGIALPVLGAGALLGAAGVLLFAPGLISARPERRMAGE